MSLPDLIILVILLMFALGGIRRGLVWELFTTIGLGAGFGLVLLYRRELMDLAARLTEPGWQRQWGGGIVFLAFFMLIYVGLSAVGGALHKGIDKTAFKWVDRALGIVGGVLKGAVFIALIVVGTEWVDTKGDMRDFFWKSQIIRWGRECVYGMTHWESEEMRQRV